MCLAFISSVLLHSTVKFVWFLPLQIFDPGKVLYIYESPAGIGICILRVLVRNIACITMYVSFKLVQILMRVDNFSRFTCNIQSTLVLVWPGCESWENSRVNTRFSTLANSHPCLTQGPLVRKPICLTLG
jgi:hypothetical protein